MIPALLLAAATVATPTLLEGFETLPPWQEAAPMAARCTSTTSPARPAIDVPMAIRFDAAMPPPDRAAFDQAVAATAAQ